MTLKRFATAYDFVIAAEEYLDLHSAELRIHYRVAAANAVREQQPEDQFYAANIEDGQVCGIAVCTTPWKGLLGGIWGAHLGALVDAMFEFYREMPGIMGPPAEAIAFANLWCDRSGRHPAEGISEVWYAMDSLTMPERADGHMVMATEEHAALVARWLEAFWHEAGLFDAVDAAVHAQRAIDRGLFHLWWVDHEPVAMIGHSGPIGKLVSVGPVYTEPKHRRKGDGSNLVAHLSRRFLERGNLRCGLGADRDNPHSQKIYQRMGYELVAEMEEIRFIGP